MYIGREIVLAVLCATNALIFPSDEVSLYLGLGSKLLSETDSATQFNKREENTPLQSEISESS